GLVGPHLDVARLPVAQVVALNDAADAARPGGARPDDVVVYGIRRRPAALAAGHRVPRAPRNSSPGTAAAKAAGAGVARPAIRRPILLVAVYLIRNPVVYSHVIHLAHTHSASFPHSS